ncbi:MAG: ribonuclease HII [Clostridia bacterium]|nr:ribonuclease HII [Clostridia bacterium]
MKTEVDMFAYERSLRERGAWLIGGMDEAGRGPLAGPVVAAAVIMPSDDPIEGVNDSKQLSEKKRERLYDEIIARAIDYKISAVNEKVIDEINILNATKRAMAECVEGFAISPHVVLVDAVKLSLEVPTVSIIKGDALSYSIAAASILAKVYRDRLMLAYDEQYPEYGFARHKGYGTREHIEALRKYGPCPIHRHSFITHFITDDE